MRVKRRLCYCISYPPGRFVRTTWAANPSNLTVILSSSVTIVQLLTSCSLTTNQNEAKVSYLLQGKFINRLTMQCDYLKLQSQRNNWTKVITFNRLTDPDGFGGLVVSMLASGTQVCEFKPGRSRWIFRT